ncbi:uncharacterized protein LOC130440442 [Diorhabda sublineata]|uniref:uncharacterized protein LOC130440442 n=1 Tax=Diorhabda sublineata TaxID=1163346 RepID=UPI0024E11E8E|nr:uncharacterized protein LOC130440442 [Diorhabda sublineata]
MRFYVVFLIFAVFHYTCGYDYKKLKINIKRQKSPRKQYLEHQDILNKYGVTLEYPSLMDRRTNDSIAIYRYLDNEFYGEIVIGHPGKKMYVAFDTAWDRTWVMSLRCNIHQVPGCRSHHLYDHDASSYYKENGTKYLGQDNFLGFYSYENISMAHSNVTDFSFIEMTEVPDYMQFSKVDGVMGLGIKVDDYEPFFYTLLRQNKIRDPIFSIYLNRDRNSNRGGNVILGFVEYRHIHKTELKNGTVVPDTITYLNVDPGRFWKFTVDKIIFTKDPKNIFTTCENGCKAIADTSSNQIYGPADAINKFHDMIHAYEVNGQWIVDCDKVNQMPKLDIYLNNVAFRLGGKQYIMKESNTTITTCISAFSPTSSSSTNGLWVLGGAFLAQFYSIYNVQDKTIGFVRAA